MGNYLSKPFSFPLHLPPFIHKTTLKKRARKALGFVVKKQEYINDLKLSQFLKENPTRDIYGTLKKAKFAANP